MGPDEQTRHEIEAEAFFARFVNAPAIVIAAVETERGGNLPAILAEDKQFGYWAKKIAARTERRAARDRIAAAARIATATRYARPDETARLPALPAESLALLPAPRIVTITDAERRATASYFRTAAHKDTGAVLARRLTREGRAAPERLQRQHRAWQMEQRLFEHEQWQQVLDRRYKDRHRAATRWSAISEQRALEIALAALNTTNPPQGRK